MIAEVARARAEANHPARLLGVAQVAIETALRLTDPAEIHAQLAEALTRIKPTDAPGATTGCTHPRTGVVTTHPEPGSYRSGSHAATNVCDRPECIAEAMAWVARMTRKQAHYVPDSERSAS